ncbi:MAG TPA: peptidoglycan DD-metalloendopeptidase family protein [Geminicoccaceae bacterium]|nr:peptidoglycan DD-metalloendopeptidase family protein [Geminicoccaceae bacterium]
MDLRHAGPPPAPPVEPGSLDRSATWPFPRLTAAAVVAFALAASLAAAFTAYLHQRDLAREAGLNTQRLAQAYDDLNARSAETLAALQEKVATLQANDVEHARTIETLTRMRDDMAARLAAGERRLRDLAAERDRALGAVEDLRRQIEARDRQLESAAERGADLADELAQTQAHLIEVADQRDTSQRSQASLRWRLASIQTQLERLGARQALAQSWLEGWVLGNLETLEELVAGTGLDVDTLVARASNGEVGQGGPFEAMADQAPDESPLPAAVANHLMRLSALQKVASSLPLAAPLDQFQLTSPFGKRRDPFNKGWAFHSGLDLGAPRGSEVLATAPGVVLAAGPSGPYGNMVEIDHGMGVVTRYGHMKSVKVTVGDQIGFRQGIGVIGSSGRSTARHLHYEIRVDGEPYDPAPFLEAGRYLVAVFDLGQLGAAGSGGRGGPN